MNWKWYIYIIECIDGSYYTGMTWRPDIRWSQHLSALGSRYTKIHKPKQIVYLEEFEVFDEARRRERQIKGWTRKKKKRLIVGDWSKW